MLEIRIIAIILLCLLCLNAWVFHKRWLAYAAGLLSTIMLMIPVAWQHYQTWPVSLSDNLLVGLVFVQSAYLTFFLSHKDAWQVGAVVQPLILVLALLSYVLFPGKTLIMLESNWLFAHILSALASFGVLGFSAICAGSYLYKSTQIKDHTKKGLHSKLPSLATLDKLEFSALAMGQTFLAISIISGGWYYYDLTNSFMIFTHKFIFTLLAFVLVVMLIFMRLFLGTRGRFASRLILIVFSLLSLGFVGSKVVLEFLI